MRFDRSFIGSCGIEDERLLEVANLGFDVLECLLDFGGLRNFALLGEADL